MEQDHRFLNVLQEVKARIAWAQELGIEDMGKRSKPNVKPDQRTTPHSNAWASQIPGVLEQCPPSLEAVREAMGECTRCKLHSTRSTIVFGAGNPRAKLVFVGEAPGEEEDLQGKPFVGRAGQLLTKIIGAMGLSREEVYIANIIKCRPPMNRNPEPEEIASCEPFLIEQIQSLRPKIICTLGTFAAKTLLSTTEKISQLRGHFHSYHGIKVMATFHPAYLLRNPGQKRLVWEDMQKIMEELKDEG